MGGVRITGYVTSAARFCGISGGRYSVTANSGTPDEQGTCVLPDATQCDAQAYFEGSCTAGKKQP